MTTPPSESGSAPSLPAQEKLASMVLDPNKPLSGRAGLLVSALQSADAAAAIGFAAALLSKMGPACRSPSWSS